MNLAYLVKRGERGLPSVLSAKTWGFYDVLFKGHPFEFQRPYGSYVMENVLFRISYPADFHAQTAIEAAHIVHGKLKALGKSSEDIKSVRIRTQEAPHGSGSFHAGQRYPCSRYWTRGTADLNNFVGPWIYHDITVQSSDQEDGRLQKRTEKWYGNLGWTM